MISGPYVTRHYNGDKPSAGGLRLSLFISPWNFMYAVSDQEKFTEICDVNITPEPGRTVTDHVEFLVNNHQLLRENYQNIFVAVLNQQFTLLPEAFYSKETAKELLQFAGGGEVQQVNQHHVHDIRFCFGMEQELVSYLERTFSNAVIRHAGAISIDLLFSHHSLASADVLVNINGGLCEIAARKENALIFYNVFSCETDEDFLYYIMFTLEQLGFDAALVKTGIAADRLVTDPLLSTLKKYLRHLQFCTPDPSLKLSGELAPIPNHQFFTLLHQHQCEL